MPFPPRWADASPSWRPLALFTAGPVGAGKTLLADKVLEHHAFVSLDADYILGILAKRRASIPAERLRPLALAMLNRWQMRAIGRRLPLLINTTAANLDFVDELKGRLERAGYRCAMIYVAADETQCRRRNRARSLRRPIEAEQKFRIIRMNLPILEKKFEHFQRIDNRSDRASYEREIERLCLPWIDTLV